MPEPLLLPVPIKRERVRVGEKENEKGRECEREHANTFHVPKKKNYSITYLH